MLSILGMGRANPKNVIDNEFLESLNTGTTAAWIKEKIGIESRLSTLPIDYIRTTRNQDPREAPKVSSHSPTDLGVEASLMALERAGIRAEQLGMVICNCCTPYQTTPSEAQRIAKRLNVPESKTFDVFTACTALSLHLDVLSSYDSNKLPEFILCVSTACLTHKVNYNDRTDGAIWGDGAAAWVVSTRHKGKLEVLETFYQADPRRSDAVEVDTYGYFHQDGRAVRNFSVLQTVKLMRQLEAKHPIDWNRDCFIGHQANYTMLQQITANREIPEQNHWHNVINVGNQAGASAPSVIAKHWDQIKPGQYLVVAVVGAGLSWGSVLMRAT